MKYRCPVGQCCSQSNWCGAGEKYCGHGCQKPFGICSPVKSVQHGSKTIHNGKCGKVHAILIIAQLANVAVNTGVELLPHTARKAVNLGLGNANLTTCTLLGV